MFQAHVLSNNTVAELYVVSSRSREEQIYLNHSVEQFLYVQYYGTFFFSMITFFVFVHWTAVVMLFYIKGENPCK